MQTAGLPPSRMRSRLEKAFGTQSGAQNEDFGNFSYKNLPVLKQANDEVIRKMREEQMPALAKALEQSAIYARHRSFSAKGRPAQRVHSQTLAGPPSPAQSASSQGSTPSRSTAPTSPAGQFNTSAHRRRISEAPACPPPRFLSEPRWRGCRRQCRPISIRSDAHGCYRQTPAAAGGGFERW